MRTCVILNPNAGSAESADLSEHIADAGWDILLTDSAGHAEELARDALADGYDRIIAAGGDGTVNEALNGLRDKLSRVTFGILPLGTGNDFARSLNIPMGDPLAAFETLLRGRVRCVDVARIELPEPRLFLNTAGAGFTATVGEQIDSRAKSWWGAVAYLWAGAKALPELQEYRVRIQLDDEILETSAFTLVIANGTTIGGGIPLAPGASIEDGRLDVFVLPVLPLTRLAVLVPKILAGAHADEEELIFRQARQIQVECTPSMPLNVDGEMLGETPVTVTTLPGALSVLTGDPLEQRQ